MKIPGQIGARSNCDGRGSRRYDQGEFSVIPAVSLVIASYNRAKLLDATFENILGQNFSDLEVIVVDDGSTDETERVVNS